jgi:hypothetical protein
MAGLSGAFDGRLVQGDVYWRYRDGNLLTFFQMYCGHLQLDVVPGCYVDESHGSLRVSTKHDETIVMGEVAVILAYTADTSA